MAIRNEVVVIGGGLAGLTAALAAAREGADVRLVSAKQSTLAQASGLVDVLGYAPDGRGPIADPFAALPDLPDEHPYSTVGEDALCDGLALFDDVTGAVGIIRGAQEGPTIGLRADIDALPIQELNDIPYKSQL